MTRNDNELGIVWPHCAVPGSIATVSTKCNIGRLQELQSKNGINLYIVRGFVEDHIPLVGSLEELVKGQSKCGLKVHEPPLTMYLHHGKSNAVFFDLNATDTETLSYISVEVDSDSPMSAFSGARSAISELLDVLLRRLWLPLVLTRLDLYVGDESAPIAHQLHVPFAGGLSIGPIGGIHQYPWFAELESLAREGICSTSPYYRLLCAYRLYDGNRGLRTKMNQMMKDLSIHVPLPKDTKVDMELLVAMGLGPLVDKSIRTVSDLHGKMTGLRDQVAHFLLTKGDPSQPLHTSDGNSHQVFSMAGAALLHYAVMSMQDLASFFRQHLEGRLLVGSVLPMQANRSRFRVVARSSAPEPHETCK